MDDDEDVESNCTCACDYNFKFKMRIVQWMRSNWRRPRLHRSRAHQPLAGGCNVNDEGRGAGNYVISILQTFRRLKVEGMSFQILALKRLNKQAGIFGHESGFAH